MFFVFFVFYTQNMLGTSALVEGPGGQELLGIAEEEGKRFSSLDRTWPCIASDRTLWVVLVSWLLQTYPGKVT